MEYVDMLQASDTYHVYDNIKLNSKKIFSEYHAGLTNVAWLHK